VELTLNLVWLGLSALLLLFCCRHVSVSTIDRNRGLVVLSLFCVVCLLFPVISMTDDLNSSPALPETSKLKKITLPAQIVVALLDRIVLQAAQERTWDALTLQLDSRHPSEELVTFQLNRRPPPSTHLLS